MVAFDTDYDDELIGEFLGEITDAYETVETIVIALEQQPGEAELLNNLFRSLHSVKSNLRMMQLGAYSDLVHGVENVLDLIRRDKLQYSKLLGDLFLLSVFEVRSLCTESFNSRQIDDKRCTQLGKALKELSFAPAEKVEGAVREVIKLLDPGFLDAATTPHGQDDLELFAEFAQQQEGRSEYWQGRSGRIIEMALEMVRAADTQIDEVQLQAAIYLHDTAMAFLPLELLHKSEGLSEADRSRLHKHPQIGAVLLHQLGGWESAAEMVEQHHEWHDGNGYPNGLKGDAICDGARIIAIIDTFDSMTHERADREHKRSVLRAVAEINSMSGKQFDPSWVEVFNGVVRRQYVSRK